MPTRSLEKPYLLYLYVTLRLICFLLADNAYLELAIQFWLFCAYTFTTVNLYWADLAWGCENLQRLGITIGGDLISYFSYESGKHRCCWCVQEYSLAFGDRGIGMIHKTAKIHVPVREFDSTMDYPGEGPTPRWSNKFPGLTMAAWNTRNLTFERF